jgi:transcriptional regulator with XRE-family HTH domain
VQLAEALGVSQQTVQAYEVGRRRIPVSALPVVAKLLQVQLEELFGESSHAGRGKRGPMSRLERSIGRIAELPKQKQKFVVEMLETVLAQAGA